VTQQARRNNRKTNTPKQQLIGHGLRELILIFFCFIGLYLFISLLTYYPGDPGWGRGEQVEVRNKGGVAGAIFADLFFLWFGYFAYLFPLMVGYVGWLIYKGKHHDIIAEPQALIVPGIGFVLTLVAGCGLAIVHFSAESVLLPSHAGGLLGTWVGHWLVGIVNPLGATFRHVFHRCHSVNRAVLVEINGHPRLSHSSVATRLKKICQSPLFALVYATTKTLVILN